MSTNVIDIAPLVSHTVPLDDFADAFALFGQGQTLKVHIRLDEHEHAAA